VAGYIDHRLRVAGEGSVHVEIAKEAIDALHEASRGTPRLINLICDRALYRGYIARVTRIEPQLVWDAVSDLGLEMTRSEPEAPAPARPAKTERLQIETPKAPAPKLAAQPSSIAPAAPVQTRSAIPVPQPHRELLNDFAPEPGTSPSVNAGIARGWMLVGAAMLVALVAIGGMLAYVRLQAASEIPDLRFPTAPKKVVGTLPAIVPHFAIQVASFQTLARGERLAEQLTNIGYRSRAVEREISPGVRIVQVLVGDYPSEQDAGRDLTALRSQHGFPDARVEPFVSAATR